MKLNLLDIFNVEPNQHFWIRLLKHKPIECYLGCDGHLFIVNAKDLPMNNFFDINILKDCDIFKEEPVYLEKLTKMKLGDIHPDISNYLETKCYLPNEIYDDEGIYFQKFFPDEECTFLGKHKREEDIGEFIAVLCRNQIIVFWVMEDTIEEAVKYDATENNKRNIMKFIDGSYKDSWSSLHMDSFKYPIGQ